MQVRSTLIHFTAFACITSTALAASGPRFYGDPPDEHHPWAVHDGNRPQPKVVTPGTFSSPEQAGKPPSDAVVLFDGTDLSKWESGDGSAAKWLVKDGYMQVAPSTGEIRTKEKFGDCQLHIEWAAPSKVVGDSQGRANSGVFLMGMVEIQVLDSYNNITYADGHASSVYGVSPPMANALRPPGEFQVYDIVFRHPIFKDGAMVDPGHVTVFVNGVLTQDAFPLEGGTGHMSRSKPGPFPEKGPLSLQDHGNPMRFRNIWYRPLPPSPVEGGTDGYLSAGAATAKRQEIAAEIRADADKMSDAGSLSQMLRYMESLVYASDATVQGKVEQMGNDYVKKLKALPADQLTGKKDEAKSIAGNFKYMTRWKLLPASFAPAVDLDALIKEQGWDKEKKR
jgi:prepilin-type processing-associated H-X9-DG protein